MIGTMNKALLATVLSLCLFPFQVSAEEYTVDLQGYYAHPITGVIEDSGGEANAALGQSMVEGVVESVGLLETDLNENQYLAFTFHLMDSISDVSIQIQGSSSDLWTDVTPEIVAEATDRKSFIVPVPTQSTILRVSLFVKPMGRSVVFFMGAGNAVLGNTTGIPATKQTVSTTPSTGSSSSSSSGLGDVQGLILSDTTTGSTSSGGTVASPGQTSSAQGTLKSTDILLLLVAANLVTALLLGFAFFVIGHIVKTEVIIHEVKQLHRYKRYDAQRLTNGNTVISLPSRGRSGKREIPKMDRLEDLSEQDWEERINDSGERSKIS